MGKWRLIGAVTACVVLTASVALAAIATRGHVHRRRRQRFEGAIEAIAAEGITLGCNPPANTNVLS